MKLSQKQKGGIERITGRVWNYWNPEAVEAYFAFTDKGQTIEVSEEAKADLFELLYRHKMHPYTVECWKKDFVPDYKKGIPPLLCLWDFYKPHIDYKKWAEQGFPKEQPTYMLPDEYIKHAFEVYKEARGYLPLDDITGIKEWIEKFGLMKWVIGGKEESNDK